MTSRAKLHGIAPQLVVADVVRTAEYYRDVLDFHIIGYVGTPPVYAMVERDGFQIHFGKADGDVVPHNADYRRGTTDLVIWVPAIDSFYAELRSKHADIVEGIVTRTYGSREFIVRDIDHHLILVSD